MTTLPAATFPKGLLLDLDGTLADSLPALRRAYFQFAQDHGIKGSLEEYIGLIGPSLPELVRILKKRHNLLNTEERLYGSYMALLMQSYASHIKPFAGAQLLLEYLAAHKMEAAIVTSAPRDLVMRFLEAQRWTDYFGETICGDQVARSKPHPDIYLAALTRLNCSAHEVIAVEDSVTGVRAATAAGITTIGISAGADNSESLTDAGAYDVVEDLYALQKLLSKSKFSETLCSLRSNRSSCN